MIRSSKILHESVAGGGVKHLSFMCPACNTAHSVAVGGQNGWGWNGSTDKPTFTPSVLVRSGHHASHYNSESDSCWCKFNAHLESKGEAPSPFKCGICHSYVTDGRIQFLSDCTHSLAGQTVDLPEWEAQ